MNNVMYKAKGLVMEIKNSNEYNQYRRLSKKIAANEEVSNKLGEFRRRSFQMQSGNSSMNLFNEIENLRREYDDILALPMVSDFLESEQRVCVMMQRIYEMLATGLEFDIDFLEE